MLHREPYALEIDCDHAVPIILGQFPRWIGWRLRYTGRIERPVEPSKLFDRKGDGPRDVL